MVDAYLQWKYPDDPSVDLGESQGQSPQPPGSSTTSEPVTTSSSTPDNNSLPPQVSDAVHHGAGTNNPGPSVSPEVEILVIDIYTLSTSVKISCAGDQTTASTLASLGFIGNAPFHPSVAFSMKTLELYRILRRRKPSFSIEAFVKVVCDLYMVRTFFFIHPTRSHYEEDTIPSQVPSFIFGRIRCISRSHQSRRQTRQGSTRS